MDSRVPKLETASISKVFVKDRTKVMEILRGIDLRVYPGEFVAIVGASGCGKTTFLRILDGLLQPTSGRIVIDGREVRAPGPDRGFVFQKDTLYPWRTVMDNVTFGLQMQKKPRSEQRQLGSRFVELVGLTGF